MRAIRFTLMLLTVALAAAGCAQQPDTSAPMAAASGIDGAVYGSVAKVTPARKQAAVSTEEKQAAVATDDRGLLLEDDSAAAPVAAGHAAAAPPVMPTSAAALAYAPAAPNGPYTLDSGDRLRIVVFGQDGLSNSYVVDASGYIAMPLIGPVSARGATTEELSSRIAAKLRQGYVNDPHVAVEIEAYRPFFILGEVTQPGQYPYVADMTVETAVAIAGGFGPRAYRDTVTVTRTVHGEQTRMTVPTSFALRPGDTVNVQERWF